MNTFQDINHYDIAANQGLSISDMISSGIYKLVVAIERTFRAG